MSGLSSPLAARHPCPACGTHLQDFTYRSAVRESIWREGRRAGMFAKCWSCGYVHEAPMYEATLDKPKPIVPPMERTVAVTERSTLKWIENIAEEVKRLTQRFDRLEREVNFIMTATGNQQRPRETQEVPQGLYGPPRGKP